MNTIFTKCNVLFFIVFSSNLLISQNLTSKFAANSCDNIQLTMCSLFSIEDSIVSMFPEPLISPAPNPLCATGGAPNNMTWFAFIAGNGNYDIKINPSECSPISVGGLVGIQGGIYGDCSFSDQVVCNNSCVLDSLVLLGKDLIPGNLYYLFVDGCNGSVCKLSVDVVGDYKEYILPETLSITSNVEPDSIIQLGNVVDFFVNPLPDHPGLRSKWLVVTPNQDTLLISSPNHHLDTVQLAIEGVWKFTCLEVFNQCTTKSINKTVEVKVSNSVSSVLQPANNKITIAPNPGNQYIRIFSNENKLNLHSIQLISSEGKIINFPIVQNELEEILDTSELSSGIYTILIETTDKNSMYFKWVKL